MLDSPRPGQRVPGVGCMGRHSPIASGWCTGGTCEHPHVGDPAALHPLRSQGSRGGSVQPRRAPSRCKGPPFAANLASLLPGGSGAGAGAACEAARGCRGSQAPGQAVVGTLGHHTLKQAVKGSQEQGRLPEFYYLQKIPLARLHGSRCISPFLPLPGSPWRSLSRDLELHGPGSKLERGGCAPLQRPGDKSQRDMSPLVPQQTTGGGDMPQQWLWHGAHSEVAPLLRGRADSSRMLACPKEQRCLAHTCWLRGLHPPARLFLPLWSPGKCRLWSAVGFLAFSIALSPLSHP